MMVSTLDSGFTRHASSIYFSILLSVFAEHSLRTERIPDPSVTGSVIAPRPEEHANVSVTASGVVRPLSATEARPPPPSTKQGAGSSAANGNNFDIDVRGAILSHCSQLDQMGFGCVALHCKDNVQVANDIVVLGVNGGCSALHRIGCRWLFAIVNHCVGLELLEHVVNEPVVAQISNMEFDRVTRDVSPQRRSPV